MIYSSHILRTACIVLRRLPSTLQGFLMYLSSAVISGHQIQGLPMSRPLSEPRRTLAAYASEPLASSRQNSLLIQIPRTSHSNHLIINTPRQLVLLPPPSLHRPPAQASRTNVRHLGLSMSSCWLPWSWTRPS